jgi:hypothetical protein
LDESKLQDRRIDDNNLKIMQKKLFKKLKNSDDLEVRKFIKKAVQEILVDEDDVTVVLAS